MTTSVSVKNFVRRTEAPDSDNPYYLKQPYGYNKALEINKTTHSILPNCCGWVHGRWLEIGNWRKGDAYPPLCLGDAVSYYRHRDSLERSSSPRVGDIACWSGGSSGHVAIVEAVSGNSITVSNSAYGGKTYYTRKLSAPYDYTSSYGKMSFQGFIRCPYVTDLTDGEIQDENYKKIAEFLAEKLVELLEGFLKNLTGKR